MALAVCDAQGRFIAQGLTNPIHLGSFPDAMRRLVAEYGETAVPGDIFAFNDPYGSGGMHLPDVFVVKPAFVDGVVVGYAGTLGHQSDIGGIAPGSMALYATEIYQEGLRIPLMKLYDAGEPNRTLFQLLEKNVRVPVEVLGDIDALVAACASCERGLERLVTRYGRETFARYVEALHDHAERLMREEIAAMPDGVYEFEDWLDGMGDVPEPVRFKVSLDAMFGALSEVAPESAFPPPARAGRPRRSSPAPTRAGATSPAADRSAAGAGATTRTDSTASPTPAPT